MVAGGKRWSLAAKIITGVIGIAAGAFLLLHPAALWGESSRRGQMVFTPVGVVMVFCGAMIIIRLVNNRMIRILLTIVNVVVALLLFYSMQL